MRNLSFTITTALVRARRKTVTRRRGTWWARVLEPGDLLCAVERARGVPRGGLVRLGTIRVVDVRTERLDAITPDDVAREGFTDAAARDDATEWYVDMFRRNMGGSREQVVTRIEFEYVDGRGEELC